MSSMLLRTLTARYGSFRCYKHCRIDKVLSAKFHNSISGLDDLPKPYRTRSELRGENYDRILRRSNEEFDNYWAELSENITWFSPWQQVLEMHGNHHKWYTGGTTNICYNSVDRHVGDGRGDSVAVIHDSPVTNSVNKITYQQLLNQVSRFAGVLRSHGVEQGDRVIIYQPAIPQAIVAMLACARIGAIHSLVFGGFSAEQLSNRISHSQAKLIFTTNYGIEPTRKVPYMPIVNEALERSGLREQCKVIVYNRSELDPAEMKLGQLCYMEEMERAHPVDCVPVDSNDLLYLLYTSGTTGNPKGIVRGHGGYAVYLADAMKAVFGLNDREVIFATSDLGWIVGHSYITYGPLLNGNATVLYEGKPVGTPDSGAWFRLIEEHKVNIIITAPSAIRSIRKADPHAERSKQYNIESLNAVFVSGEHCDQETQRWCKEVFKQPILDACGQTECGCVYAATCLGLGNTTDPPVGKTGPMVPGWKPRILRDDGSEAAVGELGNVVLKLPLPPSFALNLYKNEEKYEEYFDQYPGYFETSDCGYMDEHGYFSILARTDDIINVAAHRIAASAIEEGIMKDRSVVECAVIGFRDELKGHVPLGFCVLDEEHNNDDEEEHRERIIQQVREHIGAVAAFKLVVFVSAIPKTRSGKIPRKTLAALANGDEFKIPAAIEDPSVYEKISEVLRDFLNKP